MMPLPPAQAAPELCSAYVADNPTAGLEEELFTSQVLIVRIEPTAEASFAAIFDLIRFGIAIAAMIRMIATTIRSSISEKPAAFFPFVFPVSHLICIAW